MSEQAMSEQVKKLSKQEIIKRERKLAKFANLMDSIVRIPFTKQGVGADVALSSVPVAGDIAGLILTAYAFFQGIKMGVPIKKMLPAVRLAIIDLIVGVIPAAGTLLDIFIRPSRKTLEIVHTHIREHYELEDSMHVDRPFLHESLEKKQEASSFWKNPIVSWVYLHIPDILGLLVVVLLATSMWFSVNWFINQIK